MTTEASKLWSRTLRTLMEPTKKNGKAPLWQELLFLGLSCAASGLLMWWALEKVDPNGPAKKAAKKRKKDMAKQMGRKDLDITEYEAMVAADVINPKKIYVTLDDIGGLDDIKDNLYNKVIAPMRRPDLFGGSSLLKPTKGVLLFGPPGTGKTMLAKAIARESGANFINIRASSIQSKWFGDTSKLVTAVFTLAWKISPCIIFIDEVDAMLGRRTGQEHDAVTTMKTVFMQMWDGFVTQQEANVVVLAATNRPWDLDEAVLRRLPLAYEVGLPDASQRENILLKGVRGEFDARGAAFVDEKLAMNKEDPDHDGLRPLQRIAEQTNGYSGSDLMELCKLAASIPIHEFMDEEMNSEDEDAAKHPRCMSYADMEVAVPASQPSILHAHNYKKSQSRSSPAAAPAAPAADPSAAMMQAMFFQMMSQTMRQQNSAPSTSAAAPPSGSNGALSNGAPSKADANGMD